MCCSLYCVIAVKWASSGYPVYPALCAFLPSVLLGALLLHISYDLGLQTVISDIYTNDMTAMKTVNTTERLSLLLSVLLLPKDNKMALVTPSSLDSSLAC